jgi:hypothetical protein
LLARERLLELLIRPARPRDDPDQQPAGADGVGQRLEHEARMIVHTPDLMRMARRIAEFAANILRNVYRLDEEITVAAE